MAVPDICFAFPFFRVKVKEDFRSVIWFRGEAKFYALIKKLKTSEEKEQDKLISLLADSMIEHKTDPGTIVKKAYKEIIKKFDGNIRIASEATGISKDRFYRYSKSE